MNRDNDGEIVKIHAISLEYLKYRENNEPRCRHDARHDADKKRCKICYRRETRMHTHLLSYILQISPTLITHPRPPRNCPILSFLPSKKKSVNAELKKIENNTKMSTGGSD